MFNGVDAFGIMIIIIPNAKIKQTLILREGGGRRRRRERERERGALSRLLYILIRDLLWSAGAINLSRLITSMHDRS